VSSTATQGGGGVDTSSGSSDESSSGGGQPDPDINGVTLGSFEAGSCVSIDVDITGPFAGVTIGLR
jgi:hypothetical protein